MPRRCFRTCNMYIKIEVHPYLWWAKATKVKAGGSVNIKHGLKKSPWQSILRSKRTSGRLSPLRGQTLTKHSVNQTLVDGTIHHLRESSYQPMSNPESSSLRPKLGKIAGSNMLPEYRWPQSSHFTVRTMLVRIANLAGQWIVVGFTNQDLFFQFFKILAILFQDNH